MNSIHFDAIVAWLRGDVALLVAAGLAWTVFRIIRVQSVAWRQRVGFAVLLMGLAVSPWSLVVPYRVTETILPESEVRTASVRELANIRAFVERASRGEPNSMGHSETSFPHSSNATLESATLSRGDSLASAFALHRLPRGVSLSSVLVMLWAGVALLLIIRYAVRYLQFARWSHRMPTTDSSIVMQWRKVLDEQGLMAVHADVRHAAGCSPMLVCTRFGYRLLLDESRWSALSSESRRLILRHEAAHIERRDVWWALAARLLALLHWYNPVAWLVASRIEEYAEWACDQRACQEASEAAVYARALLSLVERDTSVSNNLALSSHAARQRGLAFRVRRVLRQQTMEDSKMKKLVMMAIVVGMFSLGFTQLRFTARADEGGGDQTDLKSKSTRLGKAPKAKTPITKATSKQAEQLTERLSIARAKRTEGLTVVDLFDTQGSGDANLVTEAKKSKRSKRREKKSNSPGTEAIIDMAYVFKNLKSFQVQQEALKRQAKVAEGSAGELRDLQKQMKDSLSAGNTGEAVKARAAINARLQSEIAIQRTKLLNAEAAMYRTSYNQILSEIKKYAKSNGVKIVRRSDHRTNKMDDQNRASIMRSLNREVIFVADDTMDITDEILERLNRRFTESKSSDLFQ